MEMAGGSVLHADALVRDQTRRSPRPSHRRRRRRRRAHRHSLVEGQTQPQTAPHRRSRCGSRHLRAGIGDALRVASDLFRVGCWQPGRILNSRDGVQPHLGSSTATTFRRWSTATAIRLSPPLRLRQRRAVDGTRRRCHRHAAVPGPLHGPRQLGLHLLLHPHLWRLPRRLRPHHPPEPITPTGGRIRMKRDPNTNAPNLWVFARDYLHGYMPKVQGLSPKTIEAYRISLECLLGYLTGTHHVEREHVTFDHFERRYLKGWLAWMGEERHYAPKTITLRLSAIKAFLAYAAAEDITLCLLYTSPS